MQTTYYPINGSHSTVPTNYDMNNLYLSSSDQQMNRPGLFRKRNERIDWRRMAAVDLDRITREMNFQLLQDNLEQITFCNIEAEVDARSMDPNFVKLYKLAQLTIEYLLLCQDQVSPQLAEYEQFKAKHLYEQESTQQQIEKLKHELNETKKESKKRRKMLETQQRMLLAQNSNYHTCPVCTHAFLSAAYLQAHINRRHPNYEPVRRREHDIDAEKEIQNLKEQLNKKEHELQLIRAHKEVDEERIRNRESLIRQHKEQTHELTTKIAILEDKLLQMSANNSIRSSSPHRHESGISEAIKENRKLHIQIDELKQLRDQAEHDLKKEEKLRIHLQRENENHLTEIGNLKENLRLLQSTPGDTKSLTQELISYRDRYNQEKNLRERLQEEIDRTKHKPTPSQVEIPSSTGHKSPIPSVRPNESPVVPKRPIQPVDSTEIFLQRYCSRLSERLKENPKLLTRYRGKAKKEFAEELEECPSLGIPEADTRLTELDYRTKMEGVLQIRRNIQNELPDFERIRDNISRIADGIVRDRLDLRRSTTSIRSVGSKLVTFEDERYRPKRPPSIYESTKPNPVEQRPNPTTATQYPKYDDSRPTLPNESDPDVTISNASESDDATEPTQPYIRPSPRKHLPRTQPTAGISALVMGDKKSSTPNGHHAISSLVEQPLVPTKSKSKNLGSDGEHGNSVPSQPRPITHSSSFKEKQQIIEEKLRESDAKGKKPSANAIAQGFLPSHESLSTHKTNDDYIEDEDQSETLTTLHTNPIAKKSNGHLPQLSGRESMNNHNLSSAEMSHTYASLWNTQNGKGTDLKRPATADSTKTSNMDSDDNLDGEESN